MFGLFSSMKKICTGEAALRGIDVSHYDGVIDWKKVRASGIDFAFLKCTEGVNYYDKTFAVNKEGAKTSGIFVGAYHFFHPKHDPILQADWFLRKVGDTSKMLPCVLDWETTDGVPNRDDRARAIQFLNRVESATTKTPIVYTSPYFAQALWLGSEFARFPLWIAHYGTKCPLVPPPWKNWTFWQYSEKGAVAGIPAPDEDMDIFNGDIGQLKAMALGSSIL